MLSHELRTPLTPVLAAVSMLSQNSQLDINTRNDLQMIHRNILLEARLIDDLLDLTRIAKGKIPIQMDTIDSHVILGQAIAVCRSDFENKHVQLTSDLAAGDFFVRGDAARLQQVFWNLLKNAVKFTPTGGHVAVRSFNNEGQLIVELADNGMGMEPEVINRIFNAFDQGSPAITRQFGGLGLGLAISKAIIEAFGGIVNARSEGAGKGSVFVVSLRTVPQPGPATKEPSKQRGAASMPQSILLVEDHQDTARVVMRLLHSLGHGVHWAKNVAEARKALNERTFTLLLSDIGLPDGTGLDVVQYAKCSQHLHAIALSGFGTESDIKHSKEAGFVEHLTKPIDMRQLAVLIDQIAASPDAAV